MQFSVIPCFKKIVISILLFAIGAEALAQLSGESQVDLLNEDSVEYSTQGHIADYLSGNDIPNWQSSENWVSNKRVGTPRSNAPANLESAISGFVQTLTIAIDDDDFTEQQRVLLNSQYQTLQAAHALYAARVQIVADRLEKIENNSVFEARRQNSFDRYIQDITPLFELYDSFSEATAAINTENQSVVFEYWYEVKQSFRAWQLTSTLSDLSLDQDMDLLIQRATLLPYRTLNMGNRALEVLPSIVPSYQSENVVLPVSADSADSDIAPLSDMIRAQATLLNHDPVKIFEFVRNTIQNEFYAGAMKGAEGTLLQRAGNDADQAALLVALLRSSSIPSRFVSGVVELSSDTFENMTGVEDANQQAKLLKLAGISYELVIKGGRISAFQLNQVWVSAYLPYANYRGVTVDSSGKIWLPLNPFIKAYDSKINSVVLSDVIPNVADTINQYLLAPETQDIQELVQQSTNNFIVENSIDTAYEDLVARRSILFVEDGYIPNSLPMDVVRVESESPTLEKVQSIQFSVKATEAPGSPSILDIEIPTPVLASQRVTLSYMPATQDDHNVVNGFGGLYSTPAYLIRVRPVIKVNGLIKAVGHESIEFGKLHKIEMTLKGKTVESIVTKTVISGGYHAIGIAAQSALRPSIEIEGDTEGVAAKLLSQMSLRYIESWDKSENELANLAGVSVVKPLPTIAFVSNVVEVSAVLDQVIQLDWKGLSLDAAFRVSEAVKVNDESSEVEQWRALSALQGSILEHLQFENDFRVSSISADKGLAIAVELGIEIVSISQSNLTEALTQIGHPQLVIEDITAWVDQGFTVIVPAQVINHKEWQGSVWIVNDELSGAAGYFIAGGLAGGQTVESDWLDAELQAMLENPYLDGYFLRGVQHAAVIKKLYITDRQTGVVDTILEKPLTVRVESMDGLPVADVPVTFSITKTIDATFTDSGTLEQVVFTDERGIASASLKLGKTTIIDPQIRFYDALVDWWIVWFEEVARPIIGTSSRWEVTPEEADTLLVMSGKPNANDFSLRPEEQGTTILASTNEADQEYSTLVGITFIDAAIPIRNIEVEKTFEAYSVAGSAERIFNPDLMGIVPVQELGFLLYVGISSEYLFQSNTEVAYSRMLPVRFTDQFRNPVSNQNVTVSAAPPYFTEFYVSGGGTLHNAAIYSKTECFSTLPNLGDCGGPSLETITNELGEIPDAGVILGNARNIYYPIQYQIGDTVASQLFHAGFYVQRDEWGPEEEEPFDADIKVYGPYVHNIQQGMDTLASTQYSTPAATMVGTTYDGGYKFRVTGTKYDVCELKRNCSVGESFNFQWVDLNLVEPFPLSNGNSGAAQSMQHLGNGWHSFDFELGGNPGMNIAQLYGTFRPDWADDDDADYRYDLFPTDVKYFTPLVIWGLSPSINGLLTVRGEPLESVRISRAALVTQDVFVNVSALPPVGAITNIPINVNPRYNGQILHIDLYENGEYLRNVVTAQQYNSDTSNNLLILNKGDKLDPEADYTLELVLEPGTKNEVRSPKFDLILSQEMIVGVNAKNIIKKIDTVNQWSCNVNGNFYFESAHAGSVSLTLRPQQGPDIEVVSNYVVDGEGWVSLPLPSSQLSPGQYQYFLNGVSSLDGHSELRTGDIGITFDDLSDKSIGHAVYQDVNLFDGSLSIQRTDFSAIGRGTGFSLQRTYSSNSLINGPYGLGWNHNYNSDVIDVGCGQLQVTGAAGSARFFVEDNGQYRAGFGHHGTLLGSINGETIDYFSKDGTQYHYKKYSFSKTNNWSLEYIQDTNGNRKSLNYDSNAFYEKRLKSVVETGGRAIVFMYEDVNGYFGKINTQVSAIDLPYDQQLVFDYDEIGRLIKVSKIGEDSSVIAEEYRYDLTEFIELSEDEFIQRNNLNYLKDPNGNETDFHYIVNEIYVREAASVYPVKRAFVDSITARSIIAGVDDSVTQFSYSERESRVGDLTTTITNPRDKNHTYTLNQFGSPTRIVTPAGQVDMVWNNDEKLIESRTNENRKITTYTYDEYGNTLTEIVESHPPIIYTYKSFLDDVIKNRLETSTDRNDNVTTYFYDDRGNLTRTRYPEVNPDLDSGVDGAYSDVTVYAGNGDKLSTTDKNDNTTRYMSYNAQGMPGKVQPPVGGPILYSYNELGLVTLQTDALLQRTSYTYDDLGRLNRITYDNTDFKTFVYDDNGNKRFETNEENRQTEWRYDHFNNMVYSQKPIKSGVTAEKVLGYDENSNLVTESDWQNGTDRHTSTYIYNDADRIERVEDPIDADIRVVTRLYDGNGNLTNQTRQLGRISRTEYDDYNRPLKIYDALDELAKEFEYDDAGNLKKEWDKLRRLTEYEYDKLNRVTLKTELLGKITQLFYDGNGNVVRSVDPEGTHLRKTFDGLNRLLRERIIDKDGNKLTEKNYEYNIVGNLERVINSKGAVTYHTYDSRNRRVTTAFPYTGNMDNDPISVFGYDKVGNNTSVQWPNGNVIIKEYDYQNRLVHEYDTVGEIAAYDYDNNDNVLLLTDGNGNAIRYDYDELNQKTEQHQDDGLFLEFEYDIVGNLRYRTEQAEPGSLYETRLSGDLTVYPYVHETVYDVLDRVEREIDPYDNVVAYGYNDVNLVTGITDKRELYTEQRYDDLNRLVKIIDPLFNEIDFEYDLNGNQTRLWNKVPSGQAPTVSTKIKFDGLNRETDRYRGNTGQQIRIVHTKYDGENNVIETTDANDNIIIYEFNDQNLLTLESRQLAAVTRYAYTKMGDMITLCDPELRSNNRNYDLRRRLTAEIDGNGNTTTYGYDLANNRTKLTKPKGNSTRSASCVYAENTESYTDAPTHTWVSVYDPANRLESIVDPDNNQTLYEYDFRGSVLAQQDAKLNRTLYTFDALGRRLSLQRPDSQSHTYDVYDDNGNLKQETDYNGNVITYDYDNLNRLSQTSYLAATVLSNEVNHIVYGYDLNNNLTDIDEFYDAETVARPIDRTFDEFDRVKTVTDRFGKIIEYGYDDNGNRQLVIDPDRVRTTYTFDALNRVDTVTTTGGITDYDWDRSSLLVDVRYPTNIKAHYQYDSGGRMTDIANTQNQAAVSTFHYEYDANSNRDWQRENNGRGDEVTDYDYDDLDRLDEVIYPDLPIGEGTTVNYTYDANYNRETEVSVLTTSQVTVKNVTYINNDRNQLTDITDNLEATQNIDYGYDNNGNQVFKSQAGDVSEFVFDVRNNLRIVTMGGSTVGQFLYDANDLRIEKLGERNTERYSYDGQSVLIQHDDTGQTLAKFDYGTGQLLSLTETGEATEFYLFDILGSVVDLTLQDGSVKARYQYDAWGNKRATSGDSWNRFGFTGHEEDPETGLIYAKARFYDPDSGRFLSEDSWEGDLTVAPSLHKYLYAYGNPTLYTDPSGNCVWDLCIGEIATIAALAGIITWEVSVIHEEITQGSSFGEAAANPIHAIRGGAVGATVLTGGMLAIEAAPIVSAIAADGIVAGSLVTAPQSVPLITGLLAEEAAISYGSAKAVKAIQNPRLISEANILGNPQPITDPSRLLANPARNPKTGELDRNYYAPEMAGQKIESYVVPKEGMRVRMAVHEKQIDPETGMIYTDRLGGFTTGDKVSSVEQVHTDLGVKSPDWGPRKTHIQEIELQPGTRVQESTVGPQRGSDGVLYEGRGNQIEPLVQKRSRTYLREERKKAMIPIGKAEKLPEI